MRSVCALMSTDPAVVSHERKRAGLVMADEAGGLAVPDGCKRSIAAWFRRLNGEPQT